jgi:hypothetical protein
MVSINIHGSGGAGKPAGGNGNTYSGNVSDNSQRAFAFEQARLANQRPEAKASQGDYEKALAQRSQMERQAAQAEGKRLREENRAWQERQRSEAANARKLDSITKREVAWRERQLREEQNMQHRFSLLQNRAAAPLTPSSHAALGRAISTLSHQNRMYTKAYGTSALPRGSIADLRTSIGDEGTAFKTAHVLALGLRGRKAADERDWVGLVRAQRELKRISKATEGSLKFSTDPAARARVQRVENAMLAARGRISSGTEGTSPGMMRVGRMLGMGSMLVRNPYLRLGVKAGVAAFTAPILANEGYAALVAAQRPYLDYKIALSSIARGGGFNPQALSDTIIRPNISSFIPTRGLTDRARIFGLGPDNLRKNLSSYGVPVTSDEEAFQVVAGIRSASLAPGMNLSEDALGKMLAAGRASGAVLGGGAFSSSMNAYFREVQKVQTAAVTQGLDASKTASTLSTLVTGGNGLSTNLRGMSDFYSRMLGSGSPSMRFGSGVTSLATDIANAATSLGTSANVGGNIILSSYLARHGGTPKTESALRTSLGMSREDFNQMVSTPASQKALAGYLDAAKKGDPFAYRFLGSLIQDRPEVMDRILKGSAYGNLGPDLGPRVRQSFYQTTLEKSLAMGSTSPTQGAGLAGFAPGFSPAILEAATKASIATGVPVEYLLAAGSAESGLNMKAVSKAGALGAWQVIPSTARTYGFTPEDMLDPNKNAMAAALEFKKDLEASGGNASQAMAAYNLGSGRMEDIRAGRVPAETTSDVSRFNQALSQYSGMPLAEYRKEAGADVAKIKNAEYVSNSVDTLVKKFDELGSAVSRAVHAFGGIGSSPMGMGYTPGGIYAPPITLPSNQQSGGPTK